ncbi:NADH-quinone oxidoreductase subunit E [Chelativorans sp. SCAU2101]|uniref:NADH-quinone oxidoreductase subunit E n=1 Tax=Chelativorans petroleitrophicus TaxID=2975484 RepID=A0A9X2X9I6_9HYPH|nr:NADH-quinone oxidoreductase subunit E [Chelativorans petroleitrophicus]MCT8990646.1 NADH-quinone oxidoreductase subunit E [Chelativorans petroleitrophicus]
MAVRRLADEAVQPQGFAFTPENEAWARQTIKKYPEGRQYSAVIPLLMRAQEQEGWVTRAAIEYVAEMLSMPLIRVLEVATFYTQFQLAPVGTRAHVQVCGTTPCMLRGAGDLIEVCKRKIHPEPFKTNEAGTLSWEEVECQGACVNAPMVMIFKDTYEDLTPQRLEEIIDAFEAGRGHEIKPGPQIDRFNSAPASGFTTLTDEAAILKFPPSGGGKSRRKPGEAEAASVPPSRAGRPRTGAMETDEAIRSPSPVKVSSNGEKRASVKPPKENEAEADRVAEEVEGSSRTRRHSEAPDTQNAALRSPELKKAKAPRKQTLGPESPEREAAAAAPAGNEARPKGIERPERPDDLKMISGVGPRIEGILNDLGIYTYAQIASWTKVEREWVDSYLRFKGRIEREDWVKQAEALAKGGVAEYERVFGKKPR